MRNKDMLRVGDVVLLTQGGECVVEMVNDCRARVRPLAKRTREVRDMDGNVTAKFEVNVGSFNISPHSDVEIIRRDTLPVEFAVVGTEDGPVLVDRTGRSWLMKKHALLVDRTVVKVPVKDYEPDFKAAGLSPVKQEDTCPQALLRKIWDAK
jgi:hypothetical protein